MKKPSLVRVMVKDLIDFFMVFFITACLTLAVYYLQPSFLPVDLSFYFFEQFIELFFVNPKLTLWLLGLGFGVSVIYFLFCAMLNQSTVGGLIARLVILDRKSSKPAALYQALLMAVGAYFGVLAFFMGPLSAWWLDSEHRGWSEKLSGTSIAKKA